MLQCLSSNFLVFALDFYNSWSLQLKKKSIVGRGWGHIYRGHISYIYKIYIYKLTLILTNFVKSKKILLLFTFWRYEVPRLLEGGAYFKVKEINNVKWENLVVLFFQNKNETNFHHQQTIYNKKSKYQQYLNCFIVWILVPYPFWFSL